MYWKSFFYSLLVHYINILFSPKELQNNIVYFPILSPVTIYIYSIHISQERISKYPDNFSKWLSQADKPVQHSAVLMLMYQHTSQTTGQSRPAVVFTKRSLALNSHKGQIRFVDAIAA